MVKICPEKINFLFFLPRKIKMLPRKKSAQSFEKFTQKTATELNILLKY